MTAGNRWSTVTETDPKPANDGIDFTLTPAERDIAVLAKLDILAMKAARRAAFTPGLVVTELSPEDLSPEQHRALFGEAQEADK